MTRRVQLLHVWSAFANTIVVSVCLAMPESAATATAADFSFFETRIRPVLVRECYACHSSRAAAADNLEAGLRLDNRAAMLQGGSSGPAIVPGKPDQSLLLRALRYRDAKIAMPPERRLDAAIIRDFETWIRNGAKAPLGDAGPSKASSSIDVEAGRSHWAFQALTDPLPPPVQNGEWCRTPIDRFILARLEASGLQPSQEATAERLLRRVTLDLTGLPSSLETIDRFLSDSRPGMYERTINQLLASPAFGERWARHWLDLARYADSGGFHDDIDRPSAWRYRDYVIDSLNADKPYGRFVSEQIAGDELPDRTAESIIATGFCRSGPSNEKNVKAAFVEQYRLDQLDDVISTTSTVFLGVTIGCARCHDHKIDPIKQTDYYSLLAVFNSTTGASLRIDQAGLGQTFQVTDRTRTKPAPYPVARALTDTGRDPRTTWLQYRGEARLRGPEVPPGVPEVLRPAAFTFPIAPSESTTGRRAGLAQWLTASNNALFWRVYANRIWQHHFGRGLVETSNNFGTAGKPPTHPQLLDWLASRLIENGGYAKPLHRLIVTSSVYRQASAAGSSMQSEIDPDNRLLWRMNRRRLEAEAVRDAILAVSGRLNRQMHGPGIKPRIPDEIIERSQRNKWPKVNTEGPEHWRRSVYVYVKRQLPFPLLELFDTPDSSQTCSRRAISTTPTQSLTLLNDVFANEQAQFAARRILREGDASVADCADRSLRRFYGRQPDAGRMSAVTTFLKRRGFDTPESRLAAMTDLCLALFNTSEFISID